MTTLRPQEALALRQTNVSNPSVIHTRPSRLSFTASEDYYSLSGTDDSNSSAATIPADEHASRSTQHIVRIATPPSRYRTPLQSTDRLPALVQEQPFHQHATAAEQQVNKTPLRGQGTRRTSAEVTSEAAAMEAGPSVPAPAVLREGGIRRKPVSSGSIESPIQQRIDPDQARSSIARDIGRDASPPTPGDDDTPYIRFALDQLTRDEEVRGSRHYAGYEEKDEEIRPAVVQTNPFVATAAIPVVPLREPQQPRSQYAAPDRSLQQPATENWPLPQRNFDEPALRASTRRTGQEEPLLPHDSTGDLFVPVSTGRYYTPLRFIPGILRPVAIGIFAAVLLAYAVLLIACAVLGFTNEGLFDYGSFGDGYYFICQYLPTIVGMAIFLWLVQIEVAVYRITPFVALSSLSARNRRAGVNLPLFPKTFLLPHTGHLRAGQPIVAFFLFIAWLQAFTVPLLGTTFNVYFYGPPRTGQWRWVATQAIIWAVIGLYLLLLVAVLALTFWLRRQETGVQWDPRSLADIIVLLERSNDLSSTDDERNHNEPARLGYWRTERAHEVFHTYGAVGKPARRYEVDGGRIREKATNMPALYSTSEGGMGSRHSREEMLPRWSSSSGSRGGRALPWYLRPSTATLWPVTAVILWVAFIVVSYLPVTRVTDGFLPSVHVPVDIFGFSTSNFLYSFLPSAIGMICFLGWLDIDFAYRRLQPYDSLLQDDGELAERSLLLSYSAYPPVIVTAAALFNGHFKIALFTLTTLLTTAIPILAGGVFWSQFYVPTQNTKITAQASAYYALTFFVTWYALAYLFIFPSRRLRASLHRCLPRGNRTTRFADILSLVRASRILDDIAFHHPQSRTDLVTRLLSSVPSSARQRSSSPPSAPRDGSGSGEKDALLRSHTGPATASKVSLAADSVRGFGRARQNVRDPPAASPSRGPMVATSFVVPRFALGRFEGRDGREFVGLDRVGR